jgi:polar amino acid transport system substrate-binding protein
MPRAAALLPLLLSLSAVIQAQPQPPAVNLLIFPNSGIFEVEGSQLSGPGAALLTRLQAISGVRLDRHLMPIARALQTVQHQPGSCVIAMPRTPERDARFRWAGPWSSGMFSLYGRAGETRQVTGPEDLRGAQIAVLRDSLPLAWLKEHGLASHEVNDTSTGLRMLQAGRVDFWLGNSIPTRFIIQRSSGPAPRVVYSYGRIDLYIACHPATSEATVDLLHAGIEQLRRNGELTEFGVR